MDALCYLEGNIGITDIGRNTKAHNCHAEPICPPAITSGFLRASSCPSCLKGTLVPLAARGAHLAGKYPPAKPGALDWEPLKAAKRGRSRDPDSMPGVTRT